MTSTNGYVVYESSSQLNGKPIVAILTGTNRPSNNVKTGSMAQLWFLCRDHKPHDAIAKNIDDTICGDCKLRGSACYVQAWREPNNIFQAYYRGSYSRDPAQLTCPIRLGAYGDPASVPANVIKKLVSESPGWTGYTHQWRTAEHLQPYCMASVDSIEERLEANALGWRTYRILRPSEKVQRGEIMCPSERGIKCADCLLCCGTSKKAKDIVITAHGPGKNKI